MRTDIELRAQQTQVRRIERSSTLLAAASETLAQQTTHTSPIQGKSASATTSVVSSAPAKVEIKKK